MPWTAAVSDETVISGMMNVLYNGVMNHEETLSSLIRTKSDVTLQNAYMRMTDKEAAVSLYKLSEDLRLKVLSLIPDAKSERVKEEMRLFKRQIRVPPEKYNQIISHVISVLQGRSRGNISTYVKPRNS